MDGYAARLASEVVADVVAALLLGSVALLVSQLIRRRRIRTFFGITPGRETIKLFLSCIDVKPSGAIGTEKVTGGSQGTAINHLEYRYALDFAAAVESRPLVRVPLYRPERLAYRPACQLPVSRLARLALATSIEVARSCWTKSGRSFTDPSASSLWAAPSITS